MNEGAKGIIYTNNWSVQYDGKSILELLKEKSTCTYAHASLVIRNEGGNIDACGVIHKGMAVNKIATID